MTHRVRGLSVFVLLFGALFFSVGYNILLYKKIQALKVQHRPSIYHPTDQELMQMKQEIDRLENLSKKGYSNTGE